MDSYRRSRNLAFRKLREGKLTMDDVNLLLQLHSAGNEVGIWFGTTSILLGIDKAKMQYSMRKLETQGLIRKIIIEDNFRKPYIVAINGATFELTSEEKKDCLEEARLVFPEIESIEDFEVQGALDLSKSKTQISYKGMILYKGNFTLKPSEIHIESGENFGNSHRSLPTHIEQGLPKRYSTITDTPINTEGKPTKKTVLYTLNSYFGSEVEITPYFECSETLEKTLNYIVLKSLRRIEKEKSMSSEPIFDGNPEDLSLTREEKFLTKFFQRESDEFSEKDKKQFSDSLADIFCKKSIEELEEILDWLHKDEWWSDMIKRKAANPLKTFENNLDKLADKALAWKQKKLFLTKDKKKKKTSTDQSKEDVAESMNENWLASSAV